MGKPWKTTAPLTKARRVRTEAGGFFTEYDQVDVALEVEIDWHRLARVLGQKARDNKSGRSKFLGGLIEVRVAKPKKGKV